MPAPQHPRRHDYYVYVLEDDGKAFYVGIGHSKRASDRVRFVKSLIARKARGERVKWVHSNIIVADYLRRGVEVSHRYLHEGLTRVQALKLELEEIERLRALGVALANIQHNPFAPDEIAEMASRGEDISQYFTNKFRVVRPTRRVNANSTKRG